jgi:hypothetical protein
MQVRCWIAAGILGLALPLTAAAQEEVKVSGRVVDTAGKPVAGAEVAIMWTAVKGGTVPYQAATTDGQGRFTLPISFRARKMGLMAMDRDRKRGGLVFLEKKSADKPVEIALVPLIGVKVRFFCEDLKKHPPQINLLVYSDSAYVFRAGTSDGSFSLRLPPGTYRFFTAARDFHRVEKTFTLQADTPDVDLHILNMSPDVIASHIGKAPPVWHVTDACGIKKDVKLSDFKGKWVLLEFWGYW